MDKPPAPGISGIGEDGSRHGSVTPPRHAGGRKLRRGDDPLVDPEGGRKVNDASTLPPGVSARTATDIREFPIAGTRRSARSSKSYQSVDGQIYTFRTRDNKGNPLETRMLQCLFLAMREWRLGGDPFVVFDAFKLGIEDLDGKKVYPVSDEVYAALFGGEGTASGPVIVPPEPDEMGASGFSLADD